MNNHDQKKHPNELYPESTIIRDDEEPGNGTEPIIIKEKPGTVVNITQHLHLPSFPPYPTPQPKHYPPTYMLLIDQVFDIFDQLRKLTAEELEIVLSMVKDSSITAKQTFKMADIFYAALNLTHEQWCDIIRKAKSAAKSTPATAPVNEILVIVINSRNMKKDDYEKYKASLKKSDIFIDEEEKLSRIEALDQLRTLAPVDYDTLLAMLIDPNGPAHSTAKKELNKIYNQMLQLKPHQSKAMLGMVKDTIDSQSGVSADLREENKKNQNK